MAKVKANCLICQIFLNQKVLRSSSREAETWDPVPVSDALFFSPRRERETNWHRLTMSQPSNRAVVKSKFDI